MRWMRKSPDEMEHGENTGLSVLYDRAGILAVNNPYENYNCHIILLRLQFTHNINIIIYTTYALGQ